MIEEECHPDFCYCRFGFLKSLIIPFMDALHSTNARTWSLDWTPSSKFPHRARGGRKAGTHNVNNISGNLLSVPLVESLNGGSRWLMRFKLEIRPDVMGLESYNQIPGNGVVLTFRLAVSTLSETLLSESLEI